MRVYTRLGHVRPGYFLFRFGQVMSGYFMLGQDELVRFL
jgi:hypothetical protein